MTHTLKTPSRIRAVGVSQPSKQRGYSAAAPTGIAAARASTTLAMSMTVALRYLEGRTVRAAALSNAIPDPALS